MHGIHLLVCSLYFSEISSHNYVSVHRASREVDTVLRRVESLSIRVEYLELGLRKEQEKSRTLENLISQLKLELNDATGRSEGNKLPEETVKDISSRARKVLEADLDVLRRGLIEEKKIRRELFSTVERCKDKLVGKTSSLNYLEKSVEDLKQTVDGLNKTMERFHCVKFQVNSDHQDGSSGMEADKAGFTSKLVFDPTFYINTHSDLHQLRTVEAAKQHWLAYGINEGRQACGSFHSAQYLKRYRDLSRAFGRNYRQAIQHYLTNGVSEKRVGYLEGGADDRWTISSHDHSLFIRASKRTAGAIDSLVWNHKEFINSWDHGRELQIVMDAHPYGKCFNPTEAGGRDDGESYSTTSKLLHIKAAGSTLQTTVHPSFWLRPGDKETIPITDSCGHNSPVFNTEAVYNYDVSKVVTIGCAGMEHCVKFVSNITIGGHWPKGYLGHNFEAPTGYLTGDFYVHLNYDVTTKQAHSYCTDRKPVILQTHDAQYAMGVYAPQGQDTDIIYYGTNSLGKIFDSGTNKWSVVFRKTPFPYGSTHRLTYTVYICVGTHNMVTGCLDKVYREHRSV